MSRQTGGLTTDAVFVFDAAGLRCAGTPGIDQAFGGRPIERISDLAARFRRPDGMPLDPEIPGTRIAIGVDGQSRLRVVIATEPLGGNGGATCVPAMLVSVRPFRGDDDPATVHQALGSVLAHELRTPMTTIYGGAQLVSNPRVPEVTRAEAARSVEREAQHLNRIVENLVVLVRPPRDSTSGLEPLLLQHVIPRIVAGAEASGTGSSVELSVPGTLPPVLAIESHLAHVLQNLIDHAHAYSPAGRAVRITARRAGRNVEVQVADDGPSRDEHAATGAFDLFHASVRTAVDPSGANLALVVARRLVEAMGGRIWATGTGPGGAVTFALAVAGRG